MSENSDIAGRWKWLIDSAVIVGFAAVCLGLAFYLRVYQEGIEPTFISIFLGIAVAAITYRYLGGAEGNSFNLAALKLSGSAALLVGVTWWVGSAMSKESRLFISSEAANLALDSKQEEIDRSQEEIMELSGKLDRQKIAIDDLNLRVNSEDREFVKRVRRLQPDDPLVKDLRNALKDPTGPGSKIARETSIKVMNSNALAGEGHYNICPDTFSKLFDGRTTEDNVLTFKSDKGEKDAKFLGMISTGSDGFCNKKPRKFDVQVSLDVSKELFPGIVDKCEGEQNKNDCLVAIAQAGVKIGSDR